mmetsp:Transcript_49118/g.147878  ORF Transcript_49118/g.147878 Transcript_49118/m.147878 type:complete len:240 (-) Transcript_49118:255-974(-)
MTSAEPTASGGGGGGDGTSGGVAAEEPTPLLHRLGGTAKFRTVVEEFYARVVNDLELGPFFEGVNVHKIKWHSYNVISTAFSSSSLSSMSSSDETGKGAGAGGDEAGDVRSLIESKHSSLFGRGLSGRHFDVFLDHFRSTMIDLAVDEEVVEEALRIVQPYRIVFEEDVGRTAAAASREKKKAGTEGRTEESVAESRRCGRVDVGKWPTRAMPAAAMVGLGAAAAVVSYTVFRARRRSP